jgi:hypothetical protein
MDETPKLDRNCINCFNMKVKKGVMRCRVVRHRQFVPDVGSSVAESAMKGYFRYAIICQDYDDEDEVILPTVKEEEAEKDPWKEIQNDPSWWDGEVISVEDRDDEVYMIIKPTKKKKET